MEMPYFAQVEQMSDEELTSAKHDLIQRLGWLEYEISRRKSDTAWVREWILIYNPAKEQS